jgi:hypothetical protein
MTTLGIPLLLLPLAVSLLSCAPAPQEREVAGSESHATGKQSVDSIWRSNERIIQTALDGGPVFEDRYAAACEFFERLTGIPIRGKGTYLGWMPNEHTAEDLQAVRKWYSVNRGRLYFDDGTKSVKVRPKTP